MSKEKRQYFLLQNKFTKKNLEDTNIISQLMRAVGLDESSIKEDLVFRHKQIKISEGVVINHTKSKHTMNL